MDFIIGYPGSSLEDVLLSVCFHVELTEYVELGDAFCSVAWWGFISSVNSVALENWVWVSGFCNWGMLCNFSGLLFSDVEG